MIVFDFFNSATELLCGISVLCMGRCFRQSTQLVGEVAEPVLGLFQLYQSLCPPVFGVGGGGGCETGTVSFITSLIVLTRESAAMSTSALHLKHVAGHRASRCEWSMSLRDVKSTCLML